MAELIRNKAESTLSGGINNSVTTLTVASAGTFPTTGNFTVIVDDEIMKVTGVSGTTFTVTRGSEGTTAASHSSGADIKLIATADSVQTLLSQQFAVGAASIALAAGQTAKVFQCNDAPLAVHNQSHLRWSPVMPVENSEDFSTYTWFNQNSSVLTQPALYVAKIAMPTVSSDSITGMVKSYVGSHGFQTWIRLTENVGSYSLSGICFRKASTGALFSLCGLRYTASQYLQLHLQRWTGSTTLATAVAIAQLPAADMVCIRGTDDSVNTITWEYSMDGINFRTASTTNYSALFIPDQVGICGYHNSSGSQNFWYMSPKYF